MHTDLTEQFWLKVAIGGPDECWPWTAARFRDYRGHATYGKASTGGLAHRLAFTRANGPIPAGLFVLHSCDNPPCCNPAHLSLGTHRDNMDDEIARHRQPRGRAHHNNRLAEDDVRAIRRRINDGQTDRVIASDYGVTKAAIYFIRIGRSWKWLDR